MEKDLEQERIEGRLCEKGFLNERYDDSSGELVRTFTGKGISQIKKLLQDPEYREKAKKILREKGLSENQVNAILKNEAQR